MCNTAKKKIEKSVQAECEKIKTNKLTLCIPFLSIQIPIQLLKKQPFYETPIQYYGAK